MENLKAEIADKNKKYLVLLNEKNNLEDSILNGPKQTESQNESAKKLTVKPLSTLFDNAPKSATLVREKEKEAEMDNLIHGYEQQIKDIK